MIWTGYGFLVVVISMGLAVVSESILTSVFGITESWMPAFGYLISAGIIWIVGNKLNKGKGRIFIDKETKQEVNMKPHHTLFFIPFQYWAIGAIIAAIGTFYR